MSENPEHRGAAQGAATLVTLCPDADSAATALAALRQAGVEDHRILCLNRAQAGSGAPDNAFAQATARLDAAGRQAIMSGLDAGGVAVIVACRSDQEEDRAVAALRGSGIAQPGDGTRPDGSLPDGIRGTIRDTAYTVPQEEHAGYGEPFPDRPVAAGAGAGAGHPAGWHIYVIRGA